MGLIEQQNFLAKLYTDENFRKSFIAEPNNFGRDNHLNNNEIEEIIEILPDEINVFADSLFYKRLREVEKFLRLTKKVLGKDFELNFREFAQTFTPQTVKKHLEDAIEFVTFLSLKDIDPSYVRDIAVFEQAKLEFGGLGKRFIIKKFDFDLREINHLRLNKLWTPRARRTFGIWLRIGKYHKQFIF